jgi:hypothetical protein
VPSAKLCNSTQENPATSLLVRFGKSNSKNRPPNVKALLLRILNSNKAFNGLVRAASQCKVQKCNGAQAHILAGRRRNESTEIYQMSFPTPYDLTCPVCRNSRVSKAEYEGIVEQAILRCVEICPFLCQACGMRFYMFVATSSFRCPEPLQACHHSEQCKSILSLS